MSEYLIKYDTILESDMVQGFIKDIINKVLGREYVTVGEMFSLIPDTELDMIVRNIEEEYQDEEMTSDSFLLMMVMNQMEGSTVETEEEVQEKFGRFAVLVILEHLARKGLVDVLRDNFSLQSDSDQLVIAKRKPDVDYGDYE